jgi:hypothetical protein
VKDRNNGTVEVHAGLSPAEQLAEVPALAHPALVERLAEDLGTTTNLVANSLVSVIADDSVFSAGQKLADVLDSMLRSAERQRQLADEHRA